MTGDGVNDVLALKDADCGIAMASGSEATRGVAQLVLLDSLLRAARGGRPRVGGSSTTSSGSPACSWPRPTYSLFFALATVFAVRTRSARHLTLLGWFTIGVPAFFLALAPNPSRVRSGFLGRVLRITLPAVCSPLWQRSPRSS